jgi:hypothetical protein
MALMLVAAAGCGGGSGAEETRAELRRRASAVDDVCRTTRERIVRRAVAKHQREIRLAIQKLQTAIGAQPLDVPGAEPAPEPETEPA